MPRGVSLYNEAQLQGRLWTPRYIQNDLAVWFDADDLQTIQASTGVSQWLDKSGKGRHISQSTASQQPTLVANGINGRYVVRATASSQQTLSTNTNLSGFSGGPNLWVIAAATMNFATSTFGRLVSYNQVGRFDYNNNDLTSLFLRYSTNSTVGSYRNDITAVAPVSYGVPFIAANVYDGTNVYAYVNGKLNQSVASTGNFNSSPRISIFWEHSNSYWDGFAGEIILGDKFLSASDRIRLEGYLAWKWGLQTSLVSSHPYYNRPPLI